MSVENEEALEQEPDTINRKAIMAVTIASVIIMAIALAVAWLILERSDGPPRRGPRPASPRTIATLEQSLIHFTRRGLDERAEQEAQLHRWEWVSRDAGVARIPIEAAIDAVVAQEQARGDAGLTSPPQKGAAP